MVSCIMLRNSHVRAFDKFFNDAWDSGFRNPFAVMDSVLESISNANPHPEPGTKFTVYKMVPVEYQVSQDEDGSIHYNVVKPEPEKPESETSA